MNGIQVTSKQFCGTCGIVTRRNADGSCRDCLRDGRLLPLAEIETGSEERPVIILTRQP